MEPERLRCPAGFFVSGLLLALLLAFSIPSVHAQSTQALEQKQKEGVLAPGELYKRLSPSVFVVESLDVAGSVVAKGSAVAVAPSEVVTNCHVIEDGVSFRIKRGAHTWPATISHLDVDHDLCQLEAQGLTVAPVSVRPSATLAVGERVYAIGSPEGLELTLSEGLVSGLREFENIRLIQTSAAISPGSSGGGLFDSQGRLVGITTFYLKEGQNLNFALPGEWVQALPKQGISRKNESERETTTFQALVWFELGYRAEEDGNHEVAITAFKEVLRLKPDAAGAWNNLGIAYDRSGRHDDAIKAYQETIRLKPTLPDAWHNLGGAYENLGRNQDAIKAYQEAIRLKPDFVWAWNNLGNAYADFGRYEDAVKAYQEAIRLKPDHATAWYNLGRAYSHSRRYDDAIRAYQEAIRFKPDDASAWSNLGEVYSNLGRYDDAIRADQEAIRLKPDDAIAWFNLGVFYGKVGRLEEEIKAYQEAIRLKRDYAEAWNNLGVAYALQGNRTKVMQVYEKLRQINPELADQFFHKVVLP